MSVKNVLNKLSTAQHSLIEQNKKKQILILFLIVFYAKHYLSVIGQSGSSGNVEYLE